LVWLADRLWRRVRLPPPRYALLAVAVSSTVGALIGLTYWGVVGGLLGLELPAWEPGRFSPLLLTLVSGLVIAPVLETLVLVFLLALTRAFTRRDGVRVVIAALPLGLIHAVNAPAPVVAAGYVLMAFSGFMVFGIVFLAWRRDGFREGFWMSAGVHALHNGVWLMVAAVSGGMRG
jgi:hypothetical protein